MLHSALDYTGKEQAHNADADGDANIRVNTFMHLVDGSFKQGTSIVHACHFHGAIFGVRSCVWEGGGVKARARSYFFL